MRHPRIKATRDEDGIYHCMSRIVGGEYLLGSLEKAEFIRRMWKLADFMGLEILNYVVMSNHYHQLVLVPANANISDEVLLQRLRNYYGTTSKEVTNFKKVLSDDPAAAHTMRESYLEQMGDISEFEKRLKQGFSSWYNKRKGRRGTLWMERFKSLLLENSLEIRSTIACYIDLNPVRAEMVEDPKDYRFSAYGAAMGGDMRCRRGIRGILGIDSWRKASRSYRMMLMHRGHSKKAGKKGFISRQMLLDTLKEQGTLTKSEMLRLKVRYFTDGLALGSELFVERIFQRYRDHFGERRKSGARSIAMLESDSLKVLRDLRLKPIS